LEEAPFSGGQMLNTYEVDNYPGFSGISGMELATKMRTHADKLGVEFVTAKVTEAELTGSVKKVRTDREVYEAGHVIIATGARHASLGVKGEELFTGKGVSYCATCDGAFFKNKDVAVVGGGDVAAEDALYLARICKKVFLIHRRDKLRAAGLLQQKLMEQKNIEFCWNNVVDEIVGETAVESLRLCHVISGEKITLPVQGVFIAIGNRPQTELFTGQINADRTGYLIAGEDGKTSVDGVYAAGDVRAGHLRQIVTAAADGANCINSIVEQISRMQ
jgi:thioredoxin reductase (NADPH)